MLNYKDSIKNLLGGMDNNQKELLCDAYGISNISEFDDYSTQGLAAIIAVASRSHQVEKPLDSILQKAQKVYLSPGQKAPSNVSVQQGKRGGSYYESQGRQPGQPQQQSMGQNMGGIPNVSPQSKTDFSKIPLSQKAIKAKASYKPATKEIQQLANQKEIEISQVLQGQRTADNAPFDIIKDNIAIEIKTIIRGDNPKITMHPDSKKRKEEFSKIHNVQPFTIVFHVPSNLVYYKKGIGSFRLSVMEQISYQQLQQVIK